MYSVGKKLVYHTVCIVVGLSCHGNHCDSTHCNWSCSTDTPVWCYLVPMCAYSDVYTCVQTMPKVMSQILHYMLSVGTTIKHIIHILIHVGMCTSRNP